MKTILKIYCVGIIALAALAARAQVLTYSNSIVVTSGDPPTSVAFDVPQFNPADGTLTGVTVSMYSTFQWTFTYNGLSASGQLTFTPSNSLSFLYDGFDVLSQGNYHIATFTTVLPGSGQSSTLPGNLSLQGQSSFSDTSDLLNFTGTGDAPLSAKYDFVPTVTWTSGTVTWSADASATMAAVVTYDFTPVPEPGAVSILSFGALTCVLYQHRRSRKFFARANSD